MAKPYLPEFRDKGLPPAHLRADSDSFDAAVRRWFLEPMFTARPTLSHRVLAQLEEQGRLHGIVTTCLDQLRMIAGPRHVAEIHGSFGVNTCLGCDRRTDDVYVWNQGSAPRCAQCCGLLAPYATFSQVELLAEDVQRARLWLSKAQLVVVIGTSAHYGTVYFDALAPGATIVQINTRRAPFDPIATLSIRRFSDDVLSEPHRTS